MRETLSPFNKIWPAIMSVLIGERCARCERTELFPCLCVVGLGDLTDLDGVVKNEIHEFIESLGNVLASATGE
jgi:hypothetical protein